MVQEACISIFETGASMKTTCDIQKVALFTLSQVHQESEVFLRISSADMVL